MNYYIQGNKEKADQIKAAFEELGYDISWSEGCANPDVINIGVERNGAKYVVAETSEYIKDIIKTHPGYQELELPVEPKFKEGDWYLCVNDFYGKGVRFDKGNTYHCGKDGCLQQFDSGAHISIVEELYEYFRLWTIADAKDGDVIAFNDSPDVNLPLRWIGIYEQPREVSNKSHWFHCIITPDYTFRCYDSWWVSNVHPATKEQRELLFVKMKEAGYQWDAYKKELRKIKPHYDIANFYAGMPVLVRDYDNSHWSYVQFSHYVGECRMKFNACGIPYIQCIPYNDDTKHLLGTTDMCDDCYINW